MDFPVNFAFKERACSFPDLFYRQVALPCSILNNILEMIVDLFFYRWLFYDL
jgi:hypothetical protein